MILRAVLVVCVDGEDRHKWIAFRNTRELRSTIRHLHRHVDQGRCERFCILVQCDYAYEGRRSS